MSERKESGFDQDLEAIINSGWYSQKKGKKGKPAKPSPEFLRVIATVHVAQELRDLNKTMKAILSRLPAPQKEEAPKVEKKAEKKEGPNATH